MKRLEMNRNSRIWKRWVGGALGLLLLVDLALLMVLWQAAQAGPQAMRENRNRLQTEAKLYKADLERAEVIRRNLLAGGKDCDRFYQEQFIPASTGYSSVVADLGEIASRAGLKTSGTTYKQKELKDRGVIEVEIAESVEGDYPAVIHFINGLERSKNFYLMNDLALDSLTTGGIKLKLQLRTYFRS